MGSIGTVRKFRPVRRASSAASPLEWSEEYFDGMDTQPEGLEDVSKYPALLAELLRRGYSDEDVQKVAGRNMLRVMRAAEGVAQRLQKERKPSLATIEALDGVKK